MSLLFSASHYLLLPFLQHFLLQFGLLLLLYLLLIVPLHDFEDLDPEPNWEHLIQCGGLVYISIQECAVTSLRTLGSLSVLLYSSTSDLVRSLLSDLVVALEEDLPFFLNGRLFHW